MIKLPTSVVKFGHKAGNWLVKNGPNLMRIGGAAMAIGGTVMACSATLKVDSVLDAHKEQMDRLKEAQELLESGDAVAGDLTMHDIKQAKFETYIRTGAEFVKLYGPAFAVGMSGIGMMQAAYIVTERRRASAMAALTALDQAYNDLLARTQKALPEGSDDISKPAAEKRQVVFDNGDDVEMETCQVLLLDDVDEKSFTFVIDETNPDWDKLGYLSMMRQYTAPLDFINFGLESGSRDHVWINDILKLWHEDEISIGGAYGWNGRAGDTIAYEVTPYRVGRDAETGERCFIPISEDEFNNFEHQDVLSGYALGITLMSNSFGYDDLIQPRMIYNEVYGE